MTYQLRKFNSETATKKEWLKYHNYFKKIAEECLPRLSIETVEDTKRIVANLPKNTKGEEYQLLNEVGDIIGRVKHIFQTSIDDECYIWIDFSSKYRRKGLSLKLLKKAYEMMEKNKRKKATIYTLSTVEGSELWAEKIGATLSQKTSEMRLFIDDIPREKLDSWNIISNNEKIKTELWIDRYSEEYFESYLKIMEDFWATIPKGDSPYTPPPITKEYFNNQLEWVKEKGLTQYLLAAIDIKTDEVIAYTQLWSESSNKKQLKQLGTGVLTPYKGKGYAKAVKASMIEIIKKEMPEAKYIATGTALDNPPMFHINRQMGFKEWYEMKRWSLTKENLEKYLMLEKKR